MENLLAEVKWPIEDSKAQKLLGDYKARQERIAGEEAGRVAAQREAQLRIFPVLAAQTSLEATVSIPQVQVSLCGTNSQRQTRIGLVKGRDTIRRGSKC